MKFADFVVQQQKLLDEFNTYWLAQQQERPSQFPLEMDEGDWHEQFIAFIETHEN